MINVKQFRNDLTEFASIELYTDPMIAYWLNIASLMLNVDRWGGSAIETWPDDNPPKLTLYDFGMEMFVAHNLVLEARANLESGAGGVPGGQVGALQSKSVDKVSASYDTQAGIEADAGHWNLTNYGTRFIRLLRMMGAGPIHVGASSAEGGIIAAWPGPGL